MSEVSTNHIYLVEQAQNSAKESMASKTDIDSMQAAFSKVTADIEQTQKLMQLVRDSDQAIGSLGLTG